MCNWSCLTLISAIGKLRPVQGIVVKKGTAEIRSMVTSLLTELTCFCTYLGICWYQIIFFNMSLTLGIIQYILESLYNTARSCIYIYCPKYHSICIILLNQILMLLWTLYSNIGRSSEITYPCSECSSKLTCINHACTKNENEYTSNLIRPSANLIQKYTFS
jgi:hypothetical protein